MSEKLLQPCNGNYRLICNHAKPEFIIGRDQRYKNEAKNTTKTPTGSDNENKAKNR
jgi:hypothetical protein